jgi:dimeric dUTPase (all-alpha-NTP-PPase superfamily)
MPDPADGLTHAQKKAVLRLLKALRVKVHEHADGTRVNLDLVPEEKLNILERYMDALHVISMIETEHIHGL